MGLTYYQCRTKEAALVRLARCYNQVEESGLKSFDTVLRIIQNHYYNIVQFFNHPSTNAAAESFNAKIKAFRAKLRGARNVGFRYNPSYPLFLAIKLVIVSY